MQKNKAFLVVSIICIAALSRLIPHPYNFAPLAAIALFAGAQFGNKNLAFLITFLAAFLSDILVNVVLYDYTEASYFLRADTLSVYATYLFFTFMGQKMQSITVGSVVSRSLIISIVFFLVTNIMSWPSNPMYSQSILGMFESLAAGIPFLGNTIVGDLFYNALLFGSFHFVSKKVALA